MPGFFNQGLLIRASKIGARIMRKTFNEISEQHLNFSKFLVSPYEKIRTAYSITDQIKLPLLIQMTAEQEAKPEIIEYHARIAHGLRNGAQREAWQIMTETDPSEGAEFVERLKIRNIELYGSEQPTFGALVAKYEMRGFNHERSIKEILYSASRTNKQYDDKMNLSLEELGIISLPANSDECRKKLFN